MIEDISAARGEINQAIYRSYITDNPTKMRLLKGVEVGQYYIRDQLSQGEREWFNEAEFLKTNKPRPITRLRRIATQRITGVDEQLRILATVVDPPAYFADSVNSIATENGSPYQLEYVLALCNSTLFQWRFKLTSTNNNVATNELEAMPFQTIDFSASSKSERRALLKDVLHRSNQEPRELLKWVEGELKWIRDTGHSAEGRNNVVHDLLAYLAEQMTDLHSKRADIEQTWQEWVETVIPNQHKLTKEFRERGWVKVGLESGWESVKAEFQTRNAIPSGKLLQELKRETEEALEKLRPLYERIQRTDELIDQIVYRLYGLTEDEIAVVEASVERG